MGNNAFVGDSDTYQASPPLTDETTFSFDNDPERLGPARLTQILTRLGPIFIKIGQFLALRPDLLPQEYCDELLRLVDRAPTSSWEVMREIILAELGSPPEVVFSHISSQPLAAGSIAQVHLARTHDGQSVAVKIQKPDLAIRISRDLRKVRWLARFLKYSRIAVFASPEELVSELERWLKQELDFTQELRNHTRMYQELSGEPDVCVPKPFPELSSTRVITTEYLDGTTFSDLIRFARQGEFDRIEQLGFDRELLATRLIETSFHQIFRMRFFHADLHPGNIIAMPGNIIGLVDFGLTDVLDPTVEEVQSDYLTALYNNDTYGMYRAISQIFVAGQQTDAESFRRDFFAETNRWLTMIEDQPASSVMHSATTGYMISLMRLTRTHDMHSPTSVLSMYRTLLTSESVAYHLRSGANLREVGRRFFKGFQLERIISSYYPDRVIAWLMQLNELMRSGPGNFQQLLSDLADGRFVLSVRSQESEQTRYHANQRARLVALAIVSMTLGLLLFLSTGQTGGWRPLVNKGVWILLFGIFAWMAIIWRRLR